MVWSHRKVQRVGAEGKMLEITDKWGKEVAERGFAQIPNYLLQINRFLDKDRRFTPIELLVLLQLTGAWWKKDSKPFPSMGTLATYCGASSRQIQRAVNRLEERGFLGKESRRSKGVIASNAYDLEPLAVLLQEVAKAFPNDFPRKIDKATAQKIGDRLDQMAKGASDAPVAD
jgi:DNA-binding transcriptional regulator YhcF (GntR family)